MQIDHLIGLFLTEQASPTEIEELDKWINESDENAKAFKRIKAAWEVRPGQKFFLNEKEIGDRVWKRLHKGENSHFSVFRKDYLVKAAAVLLMLFTFSFLLYRGMGFKDRQSAGELARLVTKSNPAGVKSTIKLPDGTMVHLNSESKITYPSFFSDSTRKVELSGEAFFEVAKNPEKAFLVEAKGVVTMALGTSFDVNAYDDEPDVTISLVHGSVRVGDNDDINRSGIILEPGEYASFKDREFIKRGSFDTLSTVGWKDGVLVFDKADFKTVVKKLERWYGLTFVYEGEEPEWSFEGVFKNAYLESILDVLKHSEKIEYTLIKDTVKIEIDEKN